MSIEYVSLEEAKDQVKAGTNLADGRIELLISAASAAVKNYLGDFSAYEGQRNVDDDYVEDSNYEPKIQLNVDGDRVVKAEVRQAVLMLIDDFYTGRITEYQLEKGQLPMHITSMLYPLRDPACR